MLPFNSLELLLMVAPRSISTSARDNVSDSVLRIKNPLAYIPHDELVRDIENVT
jgi:hypothetical protein